MKIGFFGDSYVNYEMDGDYSREHWPWPRRLILDNNWTLVSSGVGGSSQFDAITKWNKIIEQDNNEIDVAVWSFTWENRLYHVNTENREVFHSIAQLRNIKFDDATRLKLENKYQVKLEDELDSIRLAVKLYYEYIYTNDWARYTFESMVEKILKLPIQHPNIKFIFIPNTEFSKDISKKYFTQGVLLDFAFETLSNREMNSPGIMPCADNRPNHISNENNELFKDLIYNILINYDQYENKALPINYNEFKDVI